MFLNDKGGFHLVTYTAQIVTYIHVGHADESWRGHH